MAETFGPLTRTESAKRDKAEDEKNILARRQKNENLSHETFRTYVFPSSLGTSDRTGRGDLTEFMHFEARSTFYPDGEKHTKKNEQTIWNCYLPMPKQLQHNQSHSYQNKELGQTANQVKQGIEEILGGDARVALNSGIDAFKEKALQSVRNLATSLGGALTGTDAESILRLKTQTKPNPNMEVLYDGSGFRTFNFAWDLIPDNLNDQEKIRGLTNIFRYYAAPEFPNGLSQMWLNFPNTWQIHFRHSESGANGTKTTNINRWIPEIYDCICSNVQLSFNDGQPRWHSRKDTQGAPLQYTLQLSFTETSISSKNLIKEKDLVPNGIG
mgnify:CR=1 FL=1|jgi:hypothetical protein